MTHGTITEAKSHDKIQEAEKFIREAQFSVGGAYNAAREAIKDLDEKYKLDVEIVSPGDRGDR